MRTIRVTGKGRIKVKPDMTRITMTLDRYVQENGYENDLSDTRLHHEIYLPDARKVEPAKRKTVIRHPIRKAL